MIELLKHTIGGLRRLLEICIRVIARSLRGLICFNMFGPRLLGFKFQTICSVLLGVQSKTFFFTAPFRSSGVLQAPS